MWVLDVCIAHRLIPGHQGQLGWLREPDLSSLINRITEELPGQDAPHIDFAFFVTEPIGAECIKRYWHPSKIPDPLHGHRIYRWEPNINVRTEGQMGRRKLLERT